MKTYNWLRVGRGAYTHACINFLGTPKHAKGIQIKRSIIQRETEAQVAFLFLRGVFAVVSNHCFGQWPVINQKFKRNRLNLLRSQKTHPRYVCQVLFEKKKKNNEDQFNPCAGRTIARLNDADVTRWLPTSPSCRTWCQRAAPSQESRINWRSFGWLCPTWSRYGVRRGLSSEQLNSPFQLIFLNL